MNISKKAKYLLLPVAMGIAVSTTLPLAAKTARIDVAGIEKYVYPRNIAPSPDKIVWMPDGESYLQLSQDGRKIVQTATATGKELATVIDVTHTREASIAAISDFELSPDGSKLLLYNEKEYIYRRTFKAPYYVFEIKRNILRPLSTEHPRQQSPVFSADGRMVAFMADNNIYIKKLDYNSEVAVTTDGEATKIINGVPDWTYEEEFDTRCSMVFSPDNSTLCYLKYNESEVPMFSFPLYQGWCNPQDQYALYPGTFSYKYPVAGEPNSKVTVHSYDVETRKTKFIELPDSKIEYIPRINFGASSERLIVTTLNRDQTRMELYSVNPKSTVAKSILVEEAKAWLSPATYQSIAFEDDGFVVQSERSGWNQLYRYSYAGQLLNQLTDANCDVTAYYGKDLLGNVYYQTVPAPEMVPAPENALNRMVMKVDKLGKKREALTPERGWGAASFSPGMAYYITNYSNTTSAPEYVLKSSKGKQLRVLMDNAEVASRYASRPTKEFFTMQSDGNTLNGYMVKPVNFNSARQYPVIIWQYSGPQSQEVMNRWQIDWQFYAAEQGFLVVCVDGRGTGARGYEFSRQVYQRLGYFETIDQLNVAAYVASLPYADANRIGICGWSYGGYETLMAMTSGNAPYAAGVAIAPVTSWRYYDTIYTERYMLTPGQNAENYDSGAPVNRAERLNAPLLIMHGTDDDNVHLSNTMEFVAQLQNAGLGCDMFLFPGMNHSIYGCNARALVYGRMVQYFANNL